MGSLTYLLFPIGIIGLSPFFHFDEIILPFFADLNVVLAVTL